MCIQYMYLYRIRHLLDLNTAILLANALISSRIDYCNSLFASLTLSELKRLQGVQNSLCRVVTRSRGTLTQLQIWKNYIGYQSNTGFLFITYKVNLCTSRINFIHIPHQGTPDVAVQNTNSCKFLLLTLKYISLISILPNFSAIMHLFSGTHFLSM